jgi:hypothetical protein
MPSIAHLSLLQISTASWRIRRNYKPISAPTPNTPKLAGDSLTHSVSNRAPSSKSNPTKHQSKPTTTTSVGSQDISVRLRVSNLLTSPTTTNRTPLYGPPASTQNVTTNSEPELRESLRNVGSCRRHWLPINRESLAAMCWAVSTTSRVVWMSLISKFLGNGWLSSIIWCSKRLTIWVNS